MLELTLQGNCIGNFLVGSLLEFLQEHLSAGLALATLKFYMAAISACHIHIDGDSPGISFLARSQTAEAYLRTANSFLGTCYSRRRPPTKLKTTICLPQTFEH